MLWEWCDLLLGFIIMINRMTKRFRPLSQICILQDKIHQVLNDIHDINKEAKIKKTKSHNYKACPNTSHNLGRTLRSGENHHPELDSLMSGEAPEEPSPVPSTSALLLTLTADTFVLSSSLSLTGGRYAQSDPPPEITTESPEEEERGEIEDELVSPVEQGMRGGTLLEEEELPDLIPPAKASPDCPSDTGVDLHPNSTDLHPNKNGRKAVAVAHKAVSDGPT